MLQAIRDEHEIIPAIEEWREVTKLKSTYLDAFPELIGDDGRLHTTFNQTATATGRLSSTDPNLQNIPIRTEQGREIRACFVAEDGHMLISADYSQVELRLLAHIADEPVLKEIFRRGEDVHTATAEAILGGRTDPGTRSKAKMVNYGIVYGLSAYGLADRLQIEKEEAQEFIDAYLERFPKVKEFIEQTIERAREEGHVATLFGRIRRVPELRSRQFQTRSLGERLAVNMVIQGTAADIMKLAMVRARDELRAAGLSTRLVLQIHDELLFEAPDDEVERGERDHRARDGQRVRDGSAARGGLRRGPELAGGQVSKELAVLLTVAAGGLVAAQAPVNNVVSKKVGTLGAVSVNFIVGTVVVLVVTFVFADGIKNIEGVASPAWYYWLFGGLARRGDRAHHARHGARARRRRRHRRDDRRSAHAVDRSGPGGRPRARRARDHGAEDGGRRAAGCRNRARGAGMSKEAAFSPRFVRAAWWRSRRPSTRGSGVT